MTKIIAPKYQHAILAKKFLKDETIKDNISLMPLQAYLNSIITIGDNDYDNLLKSQLKKIEPQLTVLKNYINNQSFLKTIRNFHISMHLYEIAIEDLDVSTHKNQDLKLIYENIQDLVPTEIDILNSLRRYLKFNQINDVYISKSNSSEYEEVIINLLLENGAQLIEEKQEKINQVAVYYANNIRSEIEASAQLIVKKHLNNALVIALNDEYLPLIKQVYDRYHIDFSSNFDFDNKKYLINFISIIKLIKERDHKSLINFLSANPYNLKNANDIIKLVELFNLDLPKLLNYQEIALDDPLLYQSNLDYYNEVKSLAKDDIEFLQVTLTNFLNLDNLRLLEQVFNFHLANYFKPQLNQIKNRIFNNKDLLINSHDLVSDLERILLASNNQNVNTNKVVVVSALKHYYFNKENVIILGATNKNFPNIKKLSGIIDENYVNNLNYPKKSVRFSQQLADYNTMKNAENLYIFYPLSAYDGKAIQPAFNLLNFAQDYQSTPLRYPLVENDANEYKTYQLDANIAKELFFKDGILTGSVSSFERYNRCPYAYYLQYGLKLTIKEMPSHSKAYIGSLVHKVIEDIINNQLSDKESDIRTIIDQYFKPLELLNDPKTPVLKYSLYNQLSDLVQLLEEKEADSHFKPYKLEYPFTYNITDKIIIKGFIDRIDTYQDYIRIIDYKSSKQNLSESDIKRGLKLQLLTYLLVSKQKLNKVPSGTYYTILKINNSSTANARVLKSKDFLYKVDDAAIYDNYLKENQSNGWTFSEVSGLYFSEKYFSGLYINKNDELLVRGQPYNFETVSFLLEEIYLDIYNNLQAGNIDCLPSKNPCQFCKYHNICLSNSTDNYKAQIHKDLDLKKELDLNVYPRTTTSD